MIPLIIAGVGAATALGTQAAANAQTGNTPAIRGLQAAQRAGRLTVGGQMQADIGTAEEKAAIAEAKARNEAQAGMLGATSGRDLAAIRASDLKATQAGVDRAADRARKAFGEEAQELEDRKQIRRERREAAIKTAVLMGGQVASTAGKYQGNFQKGKNEQDLDYADALKGADPATAQMLRGTYEQFGDPSSPSYDPKKWAIFMQAYEDQTVAPPPPVE